MEIVVESKHCIESQRWLTVLVLIAWRLQGTDAGAIDGLITGCEKDQSNFLEWAARNTPQGRGFVRSTSSISGFCEDMRSQTPSGS